MLLPHHVGSCVLDDTYRASHTHTHHNSTQNHTAQYHASILEVHHLNIYHPPSLPPSLYGFLPPLPSPSQGKGHQRKLWHNSKPSQCGSFQRQSSNNIDNQVLKKECCETEKQQRAS